MRIIIIGAGRLATSLGVALQQAGHDLLQVYSRTMQSAALLAERLGAEPTADLGRVRGDADVCFIAVKDDALPQLVARLCADRPQTLFLHTAGSVPMSVFEGHARRYGVFYPMQTFSRERIVSFARVPLFIEASDPAELAVAEALARSVSQSVTPLDSVSRRHLHLAAVFACNFANHCYELSAQVLQARGLPFSVMLPLIEETAEKVHHMLPREAQTGPAVRFDEGVISAQLQLLDGHPQARQVYQVMSQSIHQTHSTPPSHD